MGKIRKKRKSRKKLYTPDLHLGIAENDQSSVFQCFLYDDVLCEEHNDLRSVGELDKLTDRPQNLWVNVHGLGNQALIRDIGQKLQIEKLLLIDLINNEQRPYLEDNGNQLFCSFKLVRMIPDSTDFEIDQISFVLKDGLLVSFQENSGKVFDEIRDRLRLGKGQVRLKNLDYLLFLMMNTVIQSYHHVLDSESVLLDTLDQSATNQFSTQHLQTLQSLRRDLIILRKSIYPLRELLSKIISGSVDPIDPATVRYFSGLQNQVIDILEDITIYRDLTNNIMELQFALQGTKLNEIIRILTVISTVFIPLTFIVGIYGMNFEWMPELAWWWAYPAIMLFMLFIALSMLSYFKRRTWI